MDGYRSVGTFKFGRNDNFTIDMYEMKGQSELIANRLNAFSFKVKDEKGEGIAFAFPRTQLEKLIYAFSMLLGRYNIDTFGPADTPNPTSDFVIYGSFEKEPGKYVDADIFFEREILETKVAEGQTKQSDGITVYAQTASIAGTNKQLVADPKVKISRLPAQYVATIIYCLDPLTETHKVTF